MNNCPIMLTIAGSDCSSGAGIQADLKAAQALGVYALTAVTCVVSEVPGTVRGIQEIPCDLVADQVAINLDSFNVGAIKTGMLYSPEIVYAIVEQLKRYELPLIVDPVMIATAGDSLMQDAAIAAYEAALLPLTTLLTPNLDEASVLLGGRTIHTETQMRKAAGDLAMKYHCAVLLKGGHLPGDMCIDYLVDEDGIEEGRWERKRIEGVSTHGTGCTLSAAIASGIAKGLGIRDAVDFGLGLVAKAIDTHLSWDSPKKIDALNLF